jgi:hypothetical protein
VPASISRRFLTVQVRSRKQNGGCQDLGEGNQGAAAQVSVIQDEDEVKLLPVVKHTVRVGLTLHFLSTIKNIF